MNSPIDVKSTRIHEYATSAAERFYANPENLDKPCPEMQALSIFTLVHFLGRLHPAIVDTRAGNPIGLIFGELLAMVCKQNNVDPTLLTKYQAFYEADRADINAGRLRT